MKIAFYKAHGNWMDFLVRLRTGGSYCHTEIVFSDGMAFSSSQCDGGTRFKKIDFTDGNWDLVEIDINKAQEKKVRNFCVKESSLPYDWKAIILAQIFNFYGDSPQKWFCSEICTAALQRIPILVGESAKMVHPQKMYELLLDEDCVINRQWLKMQYLKNKEHYFDSSLRIITASFAAIGLIFFFSEIIDNYAVLEGLLGSLLH